MRVAVLCNDDSRLFQGTAADAVAVQAAADMARAVVAACRRQGWEADWLGVDEQVEKLVCKLMADPPDVCFNLVEAVGGDARKEAAFVGLLELSGLPYTGSPAMACALALEKPLARTLFLGAGLPVPAARVLEHGEGALDGLQPPFIVKPSREDASHGISRDSVVASQDAARAQARWVSRTYGQPALVEEFIDGREFNVAILGEGAAAEVLPLAEIDYSALPADHPHLLTYEAKWDEASPVYQRTPPIPARPLDPAVHARVEAVALAAYRLLRLRDYGRIDLRLHPQRGPLLLEANANPDISPGAGLAKAAARAGIPYDDLIARIVRAAHHRSGVPAVAQPGSCGS